MTSRNVTPVSSSDSFVTRSRYAASSCPDSGRWNLTRTSVDLVSAARRHVSFLRCLSASPVLHHAPTIARAIRRYEDLWMPLLAELSLVAAANPMLLPPLDIEWVWHCHCLHPARYKEYCLSRFGSLLDRPVIIDEENEEYAFARCQEVWAARYPSEPFDLEGPTATDSEVEAEGSAGAGDLFDAVAKFSTLYSFFSDPFVSETVYLASARRRYLSFLHLLSRIENENEDEDFRFVPTSDILLMWLTHQSFPRSYAKDTEEMAAFGKRRVATFGEQAAQEDVEKTRDLWEETFDEPYERPGAVLDPAASLARGFFNWEAAASEDVNRRYKVLQPRFIMEVSVFLKGRWNGREEKKISKTFLRLRTVKCHKEMRLDRPASSSSSETWHKTWHLNCEFGTRGILIDVRQKGNSCFVSSKSQKKLVFLWNDLLRATTLLLKKELETSMRALASVTPPVQAPYLLKCVPDKVTDDSGAMISDVILQRNRYRPQEGRWLSRTVLDHARKECFVLRMRVGRGIWRRGAETPTIVNWEDRIIQVREGPWSYIEGTVGVAPEKVVGTAIPKREDPRDKKGSWCLSTGEVLTIQWGDRLGFQLQTNNSSEEVKLFIGRKRQYQVKNQNSSDRRDEEEDQYLTLVRFSSEYPDGKATALINWKLLALEFSPEEDAIFMLLLCLAVARTITEIRKEDICGLLLRQRVQEVGAGRHDWGSAVVASSTSPHLQPWYRNAGEVLASAERKNESIPVVSRNSPAEGKDVMYKQVIIP